jgi:hypothetical protein
MARLSQGILGGISGKIGNVVGSSWKGIAVIKTKPLSVANPQSAGQILQRTKMTNVVAFSQVILSAVIKPLWDRFAQRESGYNAFVSKNISLFTTIAPSTPADLQISSGKMAATAITSASVTAGEDEVTVTWVDDSGSGFKVATDEVYVVVQNVEQESIWYSSAVAQRDDATATVTMPSNQSDSDTVYSWLAFRRTDGTIVSDSSYFPVTVITP